jgi:hypothetical protein
LFQVEFDSRNRDLLDLEGFAFLRFISGKIARMEDNLSKAKGKKEKEKLKNQAKKKKQVAAK